MESLLTMLSKDKGFIWSGGHDRLADLAMPVIGISLSPKIMPVEAPCQAGRNLRFYRESSGCSLSSKQMANCDIHSVQFLTDADHFLAASMVAK